MKTKAELQKDIQQYEAIKEQLKKITPKLSSASKSIGSVDREIKATYKINGNEPKVSGKTTKLKECIDTVNLNLTSVIIPAINSAIQASKTVIQKIEAAEAEAERQAAQTSTPQTNPRPVHPATGYNRVRYTGVQE